MAEVGTGENGTGLTSDLALEHSLSQTGAVLPGGLHFKGFYTTHPDVKKIQATAIPGSPLYLFTEGLEDLDLVRTHEMGHNWLSYYLVPNQPFVQLDYEGIPPQDVIDLAKLVVNRDTSVEKLGASIDLWLASHKIAIRETPLEVLANFVHTDLPERMMHAEARRAMDIARGKPQQYQIETVAIGVTQRIINALNQKVKREANLPAANFFNPDPFEEGLVTYLANKTQRKDPRKFIHPTPSTASYTLAFNDYFADSREVTGIIQSHGLLGFGKQHGQRIIDIAKGKFGQTP